VEPLQKAQEEQRRTAKNEVLRIPVRNPQITLQARRGSLDFGCGEGRNTLLLARYGYHVHAVDVSSQGIQKLENYARSQDVYNITCTVADVRTFPLTQIPITSLS
jgi:2-polyprenyl-3-methyl-5-hydroxy-6-metoxy-1,4-benzoquinol methylase